MEILPGVWQLTDAMGVCMTLLVGKERALLVDCGYGLHDVRAMVRAVTQKPLTVMLTHAHHDHALGARWFDEVLLAQADHAFFGVYTSPARRQQVLCQAQAKGVVPAADFVTADYPRPLPLLPGDRELGGMTARVLLCPGHTPGSAVIYVPQRRLLLTGDNWNPCTWLFFDEALSAQALRSGLQRLLELPFEHVLCSHRAQLYRRSDLQAFVDGIGDEALRSAHAVEMGRQMDTREVYPCEGQNFVFDFAKTGWNGKENRQ